MGRFLEASKALDQSLMLEPDHAETALLCAQTLAESGANDRASLRCRGRASPRVRPVPSSTPSTSRCSWPAVELEKATAAARLPDIAAQTLQRLGRRQLREPSARPCRRVSRRAAQALPEDHGTLFDLAIAQKNAEDKAGLAAEL